MPNRIVAVIVVIGSAFLSLGYFAERERLIKKGNKSEDDKKAIESFTLRLIGVLLLLIASLIQLWLSFRSPFHTGVFGLGTDYIKYSERQRFLQALNRYQGDTEVF